MNKDDLNQTNSLEQVEVTNNDLPYMTEKQVNNLLMSIRGNIEVYDLRVLESDFGNGILLIKLLERKLDVITQLYHRRRLQYELHALLAVSSIYGIDESMANVIRCRDRLYNIFVKNYKLYFKDTHEHEADYLESIFQILDRNLYCGNTQEMQDYVGNKPIIFTEWSLVRNEVRRRDFSLNKVLNMSHSCIVNMLDGYEYMMAYEYPLADCRYPYYEAYKVAL